MIKFKLLALAALSISICVACNDLVKSKILGIVSVPSADPPAGYYNDSQLVTLTTTPNDATIYFTLDGSIPSRNSNKYTNPIFVDLGHTLKAYAVKPGWNDSGMVIASYEQKGTVDKPKAIPGSGTFLSGQTLTLSTTTSNAIIYYTIDGSDPLQNGIKYNNPISLTLKTVIKAVAIKEGMNNSVVTTEDYIIKHIYIGGYVNDGADGYLNAARNIACYWKDREIIELTNIERPGSVIAITISNGDVYTAGGAHYWINDEQHDLNAPGFVSGIAVNDNHVYVSGSTGWQACYWNDGQRIELPSTGRLSDASAIKIVNDDIYIVGYDSLDIEDNSYYQACYWVNEKKVTLAFTGPSSSATSIDVNNNDVYIAGRYYNGNDVIACYWKNGVKTDLSVPGTSTSKSTANANAITIEGGHIYIAGTYYYQLNEIPCYWLDGQLINLPYNLAVRINDIAVLNGIPYIVGYQNSVGACYWIDNNSYNALFNARGTYSEAYGIIIADE